MSICELSDEVKEKLSVIYDKYESIRDPGILKECEELGVSKNDWLKFCCDKLGIIMIEAD
jgi:hypothetical protein